MNEHKVAVKEVTVNVLCDKDKEHLILILGVLEAVIEEANDANGLVEREFRRIKKHIAPLRQKLLVG